MIVENEALEAQPVGRPVNKRNMEKTAKQKSTIEEADCCAVFFFVFENEK